MSRRGNRSESSFAMNTELSKKELKGEKQKKESEKNEKPEKIDKQVKINEMMPQKSKEDTLNRDESEEDSDDSETSLKILMKIVTRLGKKVNTLASEDYINAALEKRLEGLVSEKLFNEKLKELKRHISSDVKSEVDKVYEQIRSVKTRLNTSEGEIEQLKNSESDLKEEIQKVREENNVLRKKNKDLSSKKKDNYDRIKYAEYQQNELEQYTRRNSIRIYGMEDTDKDETPNQTAEGVVKLIKDQLDITIDPSKIDIAHRMGKYSVDGNRPVICKFISRTTKLQVIRVRKHLKGTAYVIREDITLKNVRLLEKLSSKEEVSNCWSDEGKIIALLTNGKKKK